MFRMYWNCVGMTCLFLDVLGIYHVCIKEKVGHGNCRVVKWPKIWRKDLIPVSSIMFMFSTSQNAWKENEKLVNLYASRMSLVWPLEMHCFRWVEITKTVIGIAKYLFYLHYFTQFYPILKMLLFLFWLFSMKFFITKQNRGKLRII